MLRVTRSRSRRWRHKSSVPNSPPCTANNRPPAATASQKIRRTPRGSSEAIERTAGELGGATKLFFDAKQLIVLCHAVRPARRSSLDLSGARSNRKIGDERVFRLARAV